MSKKTREEAIADKENVASKRGSAGIAHVRHNKRKGRKHHRKSRR